TFNSSMPPWKPRTRRWLTSSDTRSTTTWTSCLTTVSNCLTTYGPSARRRGDGESVIGTKWVHRKRPDVIYTVVAIATLQIGWRKFDNMEVIVYTDSGGAVWVRPR